MPNFKKSKNKINPPFTLKPVPEGNKGKGLSKLPTEVRNKMGYEMKPYKMDKKKTYKMDSSHTFKMDSAKNMKTMYMGSTYSMDPDPTKKLKDVVLPGTDKSSVGKMNQSQFDKMQEEVRKNINASKSSFDKQITSDSLTNILEKGSVPKLDQKRYDKARIQMDLIEGTTGTSKRSSERIRENLDAYKKKQGVYADDYLKKQR